MACPVPFGTSLLDATTRPPNDEAEWDQVMASVKERLAQDPMCIKRVRLSALAAIKLTAHANSGVEEGRADPARRTPIEVMGALVGFLDTNDPDCLIISDAFITPCKGGAHAAVMDERTVTFKSEYKDLIEQINPRAKVVGWYHSHPFEPTETGHHCWFSATDVGSQAMQQHMMDKKGFPFVGMVIDPQTTMERRQLHFGCFRCYNKVLPVEGAVTMPEGRTPDARPQPGKAGPARRWGPQWKKYYALGVSFYTNPQNAMALRILNASYGWINDLVTAKSNQKDFKQQLNRTAKKLGVDAESTKLQIEQMGKNMFVNVPGKGSGRRAAGGGRGNSTGKDMGGPSAFEKIVAISSESAVEVDVGATKQVVQAMTM